MILEHQGSKEAPFRQNGDRDRFIAKPNEPMGSVPANRQRMRPTSGTRSDGRRARSEVAIPQAFSYAMMKLFAFRDRKDDAEKEFAQHHALDMYRIIAMLTETSESAKQGTSTPYVS
jgi:hypothetical protein